MICGLGTDVVQIARVQAVYRRLGRRFAERILSVRELDELSGFTETRQNEFVAGRFAAKEAISKAIGCGIGQLRMPLVDIAVGQRGLEVSFGEVHQSKQFASARWHVSITHTSEVAYAVAIWESGSDA